jgi:predicted DNA-binding antitoxin AbrB/MazE fold protein
MDTVITAIYEKGQLRPLSPLKLPENTRVRVTVKTVEPPPDDPAEQRLWVERLLVEAGLSVPKAHSLLPSPISAERRAELAQKFSAERPLSDLIREERDER